MLVRPQVPRYVTLCRQEQVLAMIQWVPATIAGMETKIKKEFSGMRRHREADLPFAHRELAVCRQLLQAQGVTGCQVSRLSTPPRPRPRRSLSLSHLIHRTIAIRTLIMKVHLRTISDGPRMHMAIFRLSTILLSVKVSSLHVSPQRMRQQLILPTRISPVIPTGRRSRMGLSKPQHRLQIPVSRNRHTFRPKGKSQQVRQFRLAQVRADL